MKIDEILTPKRFFYCAISFMLTVVLTSVFSSFPFAINIGVVIVAILALGKGIYDFISGTPFLSPVIDIFVSLSGAGLAVFCVSAIV